MPRGEGQLALRLPCGLDGLALNGQCCHRGFPSTTLCVQKKIRGTYTSVLSVDQYWRDVPRIAVFWLLLLLVIGLWVIFIFILFFSIINFFLQ